MADSDDIRVPDAIEPLRALRLWRISGSILKPGLRSMFVPYGWEPGEDHAACLYTGTNVAISSTAHKSSTKHDVVPCTDRRCACGFHALRVVDDKPVFIEMFRDTVLGTVDMWGRVLVGNRGYRAQHVRVASFIQEPNIAIGKWLRLRALGQRFKVPIETFGTVGMNVRLRTH